VTTPTARPDTTRLQRMARAYTETAVLWAALDLGLFTAVAGGASDEDAVALACGVSRLDAERLVVCCLTLDLLRIEGGQLVNPPDVARFLVQGDRSYAGPWMTFTRRDVPGWFRIAELMTDGPEPTLLGMYEDLTVERAREYHQATYSIGMGAGRRFTRTVDLSGRKRMLDLGGGSGAYSINVVQTHTDMTAVVFDLPPVVEVTREFLVENRVADRVEAIAGDFTADPLPDDCDVVVMASNLPIYDADVIAAVVARAHDALLPGGEMHLIGEMLDDDRRGPADAAMWGINELLCGGLGRAHTIADCIGYFERAGFGGVEVTEFIPGTLQRVSGRKPDAAD
jgi:SAM-dependent methyltransferase